MKQRFLKAKHIAAIEGLHLRTVQSRFRAGYYKGAQGGGSFQFKVPVERYAKQHGLNSDELERDLNAIA